jgi:hypothetical protein
MESNSTKVKNFFHEVIEDKYLTTQSKYEFLKKFWDIYIDKKNKEYRYFVNGKYLVWNNKIYIGIISDGEVINFYDYSKDNCYYFIQIPILS